MFKLNILLLKCLVKKTRHIIWKYKY